MMAVARAEARDISGRVTRGAMGVALAKGVQIPLESDQFIASDGGEIGKVEGEDNFLSTQVGKPDRSPGRFPGEVGGRSADFQGVSREA